MFPRTTQRKYENTHIDMTPMVDCIMVLLVFLMISSAFVQDPGIEVEKPNVAGAAAPADYDALLIAISRENRIYFDGREIRVEQVSGAVRQAAFGKNPALIIRADGAANHATFAAVYAEARRAGVARIRFATARAEDP
jgi:biopolymer transport protein ExbD